jgi:hypothetical protein
VIVVTTSVAADELYRARRGVVDFIDVPEMSFVLVRGSGAPEAGAFGDAVQALFSVSYGAHFVVKKRCGVSTKVRPLEALWWVEDPEQQRRVTAVGFGEGDMSDTDRAAWRWQAMIMQPEPIDSATITEAIEQARRKATSNVDDVRYETWREGLSAQVMHVGPYAEEAPTIAFLHEAIRAGGYTPCGRHHEIYLGDPRRCAPEKLRTIIRQPVRLPE